MVETWILYQTTNSLNFKIYVGVHKLADNAYSKGYLGSGYGLKSAVKKYGKSNFTRITLAEFSCSKDAYLAEAKMVTEAFINRPDIYNMCLGGREGRPHTPEIKAKLSAAHTGKVLSEEHKLKMSSAQKGKKISEKHKAAISAAQRGNTHWLGRTHTLETRTKISTSHKSRLLNNGGENKFDKNSVTENTKSKKIGINISARRFKKIQEYAMSKNLTLGEVVIAFIDSLPNVE